MRGIVGHSLRPYQILPFLHVHRRINAFMGPTYFMLYQSNWILRIIFYIKENCILKFNAFLSTCLVYMLRRTLLIYFSLLIKL